MNYARKVIVFIAIFSILKINIYAEDIRSVLIEVSVDVESLTSEINILEDEGSDIDNSALNVKAVRYENGKEKVIYTGALGGYDNGLWNNTDFNKTQILMILEWNDTGTLCPIYVTPLNQADDSAASAQAYSMEYLEAITYDITYTITDDITGTWINGNYSVHNGLNEDKEVTLLAALYEDGPYNPEAKLMREGKNKILNIPAGTTKTDVISILLPDDSEVYSVKFMVWESLESVRPLGKSQGVLDLDDYDREKSIIINSAQGGYFNIYMNSDSVKGANRTAVHTINYDPVKVSPVDLCGLTFEKELLIGNIGNTGISIEEFDSENGIIKYRFDFPKGRNTGINNVIKFEALSELIEEEIVYTIK